MAALIFVSMAKLFNEMRENRYVYLLFTGISLFCILCYRKLMLDLISSPKPSIWQIQNRYLVSLLFAIFIISCCFSLKAFQAILANKVMRFFSAISFQFYVWHQIVACKLKEFHIPFYEGKITPNINHDTIWMWKYFLLCWVLSFIIAIAVTYLIEKPCSKLILNISFCKKKLEKS